MRTLTNFLRAMRTEHYIKNILIFIPLFFSGKFLDMNLLLVSCLVFIFFSLICSSVYIINDTVDYKYDKNHPIKSKRPIASGKIKISHALIGAAALFLIGAVGLITIHWTCFLVAMIYFALNILYSIYFKNMPLLDVFCIALGFVLRIYVGSTAVSVTAVSYTHLYL